MKLKYSLMVSVILAGPAAWADGSATPANPTNAVAPVSPDTRYGLFNGLDHRSFYGEGDFPEPFLVDDSGLEMNEARLDWLHTQADAMHSDRLKAEVEKGFGLLTVELEVPYVRQAVNGVVAQGLDNIDLGARYPLYQYVSANNFFDTTFGGAMEVGIPASSAISVNPEFVPKIFNDTKIGEHFTVQSVYGYSTLTGGGADGGRETFEYGFTFGWFIEHKELPVPGVQRIIPMFELAGGTALNKDNAGQNSLQANAGLRVNLKAIGRVQPRLGAGFVFPVDNGARSDTHWGVITSLVFEY